jgi:Asp-tRNA(Asn)/Glu-tRNA(Gln) amidotransferase A subunit family amidase
MLADPRMDIAGWRSRVATLGCVASQERTLERARLSRSEHASFIAVGGVPTFAGSGVLDGVPFAVKDNIDTADLPTTGGNALLADWRPRDDAPAVSALRKAGAWVVGKTNLHELAFGVTSENATYGSVRIPHDHARSAGGSSGGSAAAVAFGVVPFALATDTGGSATIPAAACGVVGYRPSSNRYETDGVIHLSRTRDEVGIIATTVDDIRLVDTLLRKRGAPAIEPIGPLRLGVPERYLRDLDPRIAAVIEDALARLPEAGIQLVAADIDHLVDRAHEHGFAIVGFEAPRELGSYLRAGPGRRGSPNVRELASGARSLDVRELLAHLLDEPVPSADYERAILARAASRESMAQTLADLDCAALIYPTLPCLTPLIGEPSVDLPSGRSPAFPALTRHTETGAFLGSASMTIPIDAGEGLRVGLTIEVPPGHDEALMTIAAAIARRLSPPNPGAFEGDENDLA